jgi:hypothetical protein
LKWLCGNSILPKEGFFFVFFKDFRNNFHLNSGEDGLTRGKAAAVAFVPGFSPLRRMNKIWGQQRLEQRSVRGAFTQAQHTSYSKTKERPKQSSNH